MSKLINQPIQLQFKGSFPAAFHCGHEFKVKYILNHWREGGQWWLDEPELFVYEVLTNDAAANCIFCPALSRWFVSHPD